MPPFKNDLARWNIIALLLATLIPAGCSEAPRDDFQGYAEGEYIYVAAPLAGQLNTLNVQRGDQVAAGAPLFSLEHQFEAAAVAAAEQDVARAGKRLADLKKGERPSELAAIEARLEQAKASEQLARVELDRRRNLFADQVISASDLDQVRTTWERSRAAVDELTATLKTARLGGRSDLIAAAGTEVAAARERLRQARWQLEQKSQAAPAAGLVNDTYFTAGEFVPAAAPVVSLLPPEGILIRFFVPEPLVGKLAVGQQLAVSFDGAKKSYAAQINYISPQAEYTPPLIYSRDTRSKLVFMVKARPEAGAATLFHPGQPVDVRLTSRHE